MPDYLRYSIIVSLFTTLILATSCQPKLSGRFISTVEPTQITTAEGKTYTLPKADDSQQIIYLVRHAEKQKGGGDPELTSDGTARAERLAKILADVPLDMIYSSKYNRTRATAGPTAEAKGLSITNYNPRKLEELRELLFDPASAKKYTLVVGHSNSTPNLINLLLGEERFAHIPETDYDNFFIVVRDAEGNINITDLKY